jgi:hypothetical protein
MEKEEFDSANKIAMEDCRDFRDTILKPLGIAINNHLTNFTTVLAASLQAHLDNDGKHAAELSKIEIETERRKMDCTYPQR